MKQILLVLILIAALASLGVGGTLAAWVVSDTGDYSFEASLWDCDWVGSHGWWKNWPNHLHLYPHLEDDINFWLNEMNNPLSEWYSDWLMPNMDTYPDINVADMVLLIEQGEGPIAEHQFLMQYLPQRLNQMSGRQSPSSRHDVMSVPTYKKYYQDYGYDYLVLLDPYDASGQEIIAAIETKYSTSPTDEEFGIMKDVCDALNNLSIKLD